MNQTDWSRVKNLPLGPSANHDAFALWAVTVPDEFVAAGWQPANSPRVSDTSGSPVVASPPVPVTNSPDEDALTAR